MGLFDEVVNAKKPVKARELGRWLDSLLSQIDPITQRISNGDGGGGGAPTNAPYLTLGTNTTLTAERSFTHDGTLDHIDGGANGEYTLRVNYPTPEYNVTETRYLVMDANGNGDFTTLLAAVNYAVSNVSGAQAWVIEMRTDTSEDFNSVVIPNGLQLTVLGNRHKFSGRFFVGGDGRWTVKDVWFYSGVDNAPVVSTVNGGNVRLINCEVDAIDETALAAGAARLEAWHCVIYQSLTTTRSLVGYGTSDAIYLYNCTLTGWTSNGVVTANPGAAITLHNCRIINSGSGEALKTAGGTIYVGRSLYNTASINTTGGGSIAVLDGDGTSTAHVAESDPHSQYQRESEKGIANGYASLDSSALVPFTQLPTGTGGSQVAVGSHTHASADADAIHDNVSGEIHAITEKVVLGGDDEVVIEDSADGYAKKRAKVSNLISGVGTIGGTTGSTDNAILRADGTGGATAQASSALIDDSGSVNIPTGQQYKVNNAQHQHVEADLVLADNTTNNASTSKHGFAPKLTGDATKYLDSNGGWSIPSASGGSGYYDPFDAQSLAIAIG